MRKLLYNNDLRYFFNVAYVCKKCFKPACSKVCSNFGTAKGMGQTAKTAAEAWAIKYVSSDQVITRENINFKTSTVGT
jgi:hypothetical protein